VTDCTHAPVYVGEGKHKCRRCKAELLRSQVDRIRESVIEKLAEPRRVRVRSRLERDYENLGKL